MKLLLLTLVSTVLFSCTEYQYLTLESDNAPKNSKKDFVAENDSVKVTYHFNGDHGPVQITIYNKTSEPLEINWKRSALIMNDKATSYYTPNMTMSGSIDHLYVPEKKTDLNVRSESNLDAKITADQETQFILPNSSVTKATVQLPVNFIFIPADKQKKTAYKEISDYTATFKETTYTKEQSPVSFRSYLWFDNPKDPAKQFSMEQKFYVSDIRQAAIDPIGFPQELVNRGDVFYVK